MIAKFDQLNRFENPKITLCNPDSYITTSGHIINSIGVLSDVKNYKHNYNFNAQCDGNFTYYKPKSNDEQENKFLDNIFNSIEVDRYIYIEDFGFAVISNVSNNTQKKNVKEINFTSCDKELEFCEAPFLTTKETATDTLENFLILWKSCCPMWSVGYISNDLKKNENLEDIYRTIVDITSENAYDFLINEVQDAFDCIVDFDYIHREINVYSQKEYVEHNKTNIIISKDVLLDELSSENSFDNTYTALEVEGDNELEIRMVNPVGNNFVYNFSSDNPKLQWMPKDLRDKVKQWYSNIQQYKDEYYKLAPLWYQAQEDFNKLYQDYQVVNTNLILHLQELNNINNSNATDDVKTPALDKINDEIEIDLNGGYREIDISFQITNIAKSDGGTITIDKEEWNPKKYYAYLDGDSTWVHLTAYDFDNNEEKEEYFNLFREDWNNQGKPYPIYECTSVDACNYNDGYFFQCSKEIDISEIPASPNDWASYSRLFKQYTGLHEYGDFVGGKSAEKDDPYYWWAFGDEISGNSYSLMKLELIRGKYTVTNSIEEECKSISYVTLKNKINDINKKCSLSTYFTDNDLKRLSNYIKPGKFVDNSITITDSMTYQEKAQQAKDLMAKAENKLASILTNGKKFSVNVKNFIFDKCFKHFTDQLKSGCIISVETSDNFFEKFHLTNFSVDYEEKTISFTLGNKYNKFDIKSLFDEVLGDISKSTSQIFKLKQRVSKLEQINENS